MYKTVTEITQNVITKIGLVAGTSVQTYTEPQIKDAIQDASDLLFRKRFWEHLSDWHTYSLDGVNGYLTTPLTDIVNSHEDAKDFFMTNSRQKIVKPVNSEHLIATGSAALYYTPIKYGDVNFSTRVFKFWPITATGTVTFYARTRPADYNNDSIVPFPRDMITYAAAWLILETDGLNPGNAQKMQNLFQISYNDYMSSISDDVIGHNGGRYAYTVWPS